MPRKPRIHVENGFYHVTMRGNHQQPIFHNRGDQELLDRIVARTLEHTGASVHAYCWMTNHIHLIVRVRDTPLGVTMQRICTKFARLVQARLPTTGHLFERRYFAAPIEADAYLLQALRYIHLNPVKARFVSDPAEYPWSSHCDYLGGKRQSWVSTSFVLGMLHPEELRARAVYRTFLQQGVRDVHDAAAGTGAKDREPELPEPALPRADGMPLIHASSPSLAEITARVCEELGVAPEELHYASSTRRLVSARAEIARRAIDERVASLTHVARHFNRSAAALSRAVVSRRRNASVASAGEQVTRKMQKCNE